MFTNLHAIEHTEQSREGKSRGKHRFHLDQRQIPVVVFEFFLIPLDFFLVRLVQRIAVSFLTLFHCKRIEIR